MIPLSLPKQAGDTSPTALRAILTAAAEVEAAELTIKQEVLTAARAGDVARVELIMSRWMTVPVMEVLLNRT